MKAGQVLVFNGTDWEFSDSLPNNFSIGTMLAITEPDLQEGIVKIMTQSFTDPKHIELFIERYSPTEELKVLRNTIWQLIK